jgi:hypothetical protein
MPGSAVEFAALHSAGPAELGWRPRCLLDMQYLWVRCMALVACFVLCGAPCFKLSGVHICKTCNLHCVVAAAAAEVCMLDQLLLLASCP